MATIDSLDIQIAGSAKKANDAVDSLITNLERLANSLNINTSGLEKIGKSLNLGGIGKSTKAIENQMQKISKNASEAAKEFESKFKDISVRVDFSKPEAELRKFLKQAQAAENALSRIIASSSADKQIGAIEKWSASLAQANNAIKLIEKNTSKTQVENSKSKMEIFRFDGGIKGLKEYEKELESFKEDIKSIEKQFSGMSNVPKGLFDTPLKELRGTIDEIKETYPQATSIIEKFEKELERLRNVSAGLTREPRKIKIDTSSAEKAKEKIRELKKEFDKFGMDFKFKGDFEQLKTEIQKAKSELDGLLAKEKEMISAGEVNTSDFEKLEESIARVGNKIPILEGLRDRTVDFSRSLQQLKIPEIKEENLKKLQNALRKTEEAADNLKTKLANGIAMGGISPNIDDKTFKNLTIKIAESEKRAEALRKKISEIGDVKPQISKWSKLNAIISVLGKTFDTIKGGASSALNSIKQLGRGFQNLASTIKKISSAASNMFGNIIHLSSRAVSAVASSGKGMASAFSGIAGRNGGIRTAASGLGKLTKLAGGLLAAKGIINFGKEAIELGSNITEVENVVDVAFGSMAQHAYDFAATATEKFGLSELAAKQYSGTMMAMLKSSGIATQSAAQMSTTLAGLAGDIASFYNIDTDTAFEKLRSGIAGQVMPLRQLGINMTVANLNAYAMSKGITKAYKDMSQAEQTMLRYNYILAKTGDAQGDFARTSGSWANQIRLLKLNFQSLAATIGQGLIAALLPVIKLLNKLMGVLMKAAQAFKSFMYTLTGKKMEVKTGGFLNDVEDVEDIGDAGDDASSGLDKATDSAKKLKKALSVLPFDELNQLADHSDDISKASGAGAGDVGNLGTGDFGLEDIGNAGEGIEEPINAWAKKIRDAFLAHDWHGVGETIAEMLNTGLQKVYDVIEWGNVGPKIEKFVDAFSTAFNALVYHLDWDLLGRTVGTGINTLANTFNLLAEKINFELIGKKLSVGLRGMIREIKWRKLGNALGNYFMISWRMFEGFVDDMWRKSDLTHLSGWAEMGMALANGVNGLFEKIELGRIGSTLASAFNGIVEALEYLSLNIRWNNIADNISEGFTNAIEGIDLQRAGGVIGNFATKILAMLLRSAENTPWDEFGEKVAQFLLNVPWATLIGQVFDLISAVFGRALSGFLGEMLNNSELIGSTVAQVVNGAVDHLRKFTTSIDWEGVGRKISNGLNRMINGISWAEAGKELSNFATSLLGTFETVAEETDWEGFGKKIGDFITNIQWGTILRQAFETITQIFGGLITGLGGKILEKMPSIGTALSNGFNLAFETLKSFVSSMDGRWSEIGSTIAESLNNMIHGINWEDAGKTFGDFVKGVIDTIFTVAAKTDWVAFGKGIGDFLDGIPWLEILGKVAATLATVIGEVIAGLLQTTSGKFILLFKGLKLVIKGAGLGNSALKAVNEFAKNMGLLPEGVNSAIPGLIGAIGKITGGEKGGGILHKIASAAKSVAEKAMEKFGLLPKGVTDAIPGISEGVEQIAGGTGLFSKIFAGASGLVSKIGPVLGKIGSVIFSPQGAMIAGIAAGVALIIANWDDIKKAAEDVWGGVKTVFSDTWEGITTMTHDAWDGFNTYLKDVWEGTKTVLKDVWGGIKTVASDVWGAITGKNSKNDSEVGADMAASLEKAKESIDRSLAEISSSISQTMESIKTVTSSSMAQIANTFSSGWKAISVSANSALGQQKSEVESTMSLMKSSIDTHMQLVSDAFLNGWKSAATSSSASIKEIGRTVDEKMASMKLAINGYMQQIATSFSDSWKAIGNSSTSSTSNMLKDVNEKMSNMAQVVKTHMKTAGDAYASGWKSSENATSGSLSRIKSTVYTDMSKIQNTAKEKMNEIQSAFKEKWSGAKDSAKKSLSELSKEVSSKMRDVKSAVSSSMKDVVTSYKKGMSDMKSATTDKIGEIAKEFKGLSNKIGNAIGSLYKTGQNAANSFANGFKSVHIPVPHLQVANWTQQTSGSATYSVPNYEVNWYKKGGLFYNPSIIGVGESGKEAVLPIENQRTMSMIAESIVGNISGFGMGLTKEDVVEAVQEGVVMAMISNQQNTPPINVYATLKTEDDEVLARAVTRGMAKNNYRMRPSMT